VANQRTAADDAGTGLLLALDALPDAHGGIERPYAPEAEAALYSARQNLREIAVLSGHGGRVASAMFSPDGRRVVTGSYDGTARIWDTATGKTITVLGGGAGVVVTRATFSPDGRRVVTASMDNVAQLWDTETGKTITLFRGHADYLVSATFSPDGRRVLTGSEDKTARIWDIETGKTVNVFDGHSDIVVSAAFSPEGGRVVTASATRVRSGNVQLLS
jgi:WD40 repeat protein